MTQRLVLSGPMSGRPDFGFAQLDDAKFRLTELGYDVCSPADMDRARGWVKEGIDPTGYTPNTITHTDRFDYETAMQACLDEIGAADGIVLLDGWGDSPGCLRELAEARRLNKKVYRLTGDTLTEMGIGQIDSEQTVPARPDFEGLRVRLERMLIDSEEPTLKMTDVHGDYEHRITDPVTGGQKGRKLARFDLLPPDALWALAEHYGKNAIEHGGKYEARNWERGYDWSLSYAGLQRHANAFWLGEERDEEGNLHLAALAWHAMNLLAFALRCAGTDDRPKRAA